MPARAAWPLLLLSLAACGHRAAVSTDDAALPLRKVVIYRNGVGYFERAGTVDAERIAFRVKPEHVGDFLATLAVMERGGSAVRSAAFPLERPADAGAPDAGAEAPPALRTVELALDGKRHDLAVGYVVEQPVWRPTYRLVVGADGLELQAWAIVQNVSGEDWRDVQLSLVAGAPIAFRATLATPVTPQRPVVNDQGELITAVPRGQTSLAQRPPPPPAAPSAAPSAAPGKKARPPARAPGSPSAGVSVGEDFLREAPAEAAAPEEAEEAGPSLPRNTALLATTSVTGGATRYDVPHPVSVPDASASMVLLVARKVPGEAVRLYAPDPGVPDSARHPFRVARFTNDTPGLLERGPLAVYEAGSFLGQGMVEPLPAGGRATVPFSLDRALAVDSQQQGSQQDARLALVEGGVLTVERDWALTRTYRVRNGDAAPARVLLRHPRTAETRLHAPPPGTEDEVGAGVALVPAQVEGHGTAEVRVEERRAMRQRLDWFDPAADQAVAAFLADPRADRAQAAALREAWEVRARLVRSQQELQKVSAEHDVLSRGAADVRANLKALSRSGAAELKARLQTRLAELDRRLADLTDARVRLELQVNEARVDFEERVRVLRVVAPPTPAAT